MMGQILVRKLDDAIKERLRARAKRNGRSLEAEARAVLEEAAYGSARHPTPTSGLGVGTELIGRFKTIGLTQAAWDEFNEGLQAARKQYSVRLIDFNE
jgi:antitoxin FitA